MTNKNAATKIIHWLKLSLMMMTLMSCTQISPTDQEKTPAAVAPKQGHFSTGKRIYPTSPNIYGYIAQGNASWYHISEHGAKTASGEIYDLYGLTAAHATLPFWSRVKVTNLRTGRSVIVTINDRFYNHQTLIKLSFWAARNLGLTRRDSPVEVRGLSK
jgi:rare lipoprotein A